MNKLTIALFIILISTNTYAQVNLNSGLVAYLPFSGNFEDASGNGNNGVPQNSPSFTNDQWGNPNAALTLDGTDFVQIPAAADITISQAASICFRFRTTSTAEQTIIAKSDYTTGNDMQFQIATICPPCGNNGISYCTNHKTDCTTTTFLGSNYIYGDVINANQWYCVIMTFDNGIKKIYINGTLSSQGTVTGTPSNNSITYCPDGQIHIGNWWTGDHQAFTGDIDEVRLYNRALNTAEIDSICNYVPSVDTAQPCLTNSLTINTGYNPITGLAIAPSANGGTPVADPHWTVTSVSPDIATAIAATPISGLTEVSAGSSADVITPFPGGWITNPPANPGCWINCVNANEYYDNGSDTLSFNMLLSRSFRLCSDDSIKLDFNMACDNYISSLSIDGTLLPFSESAVPCSLNNFNAYANFIQTIFLTAGTHTISIEANNASLYTCNPGEVQENQVGFNLYGTVSSATATHSLVSESSAACNAYVCNSTPPDTTCNTVSLPDSLHICAGSVDTIHAIVAGSDSVLNIHWSPVAGLSDTSILNPAFTASASGWRHVTVESLIPGNLVVNGDFSAGNTGFTSAYTYQAPPSNILNANYYSICTNPQNVFSSATPFGDHTTGTGNMMMMNGASTPVSVWCETISVTPNTNYAFSAWFANWSADTSDGFPAILFKINGALLGSAYNFPHADGIWRQFYTNWNSGTNTSIDICIYDNQTAANGNDFAIDDISFQRICTATDSVYVATAAADTNHIVTDTAVCSIASFTLTAPFGYSSYHWDNGSTTSSINATTPGKYWVAETGNCGLLVDTFNVTSAIADTSYTHTDVTPCADASGATLTASSGYISYLWNTGDTTSSISITTTGAYWVAETGNCGSYLADTFHVSRLLPLTISVTNDTAICRNDKAQLIASGAHTYSWTPTSSLNNATIANPIAMPEMSTTYTVTGIDTNGCVGVDSIQVGIIAAPVLTIANAGNITCDNQAVQLNATGAAKYRWLPAQYCNDQNIANPIVSPTNTTTFYLTGYNEAGCSTTDSVKVTVVEMGDVVIPNAFTPNGDGINDVIYPIAYCNFTFESFKVYNRWGQCVFSTTNYMDGWDGKFNGVVQPLDVYMYYVTGFRGMDKEHVMKKGNITLLK